MAIEIKTLYKSSYQKSIDGRIDKIIYILLKLFVSIINGFVPFVAGFYLGQTNRLFWIFPFIIVLIINLRVVYEKGIFKLEILNNFWK